MNKKRIRMLRHACICSTMSLLLCCVMLIGTTYAWLHDTVTSGNNRVIAGSIDMALLRYEMDSDGSYLYEDIADGDQVLFSGNWEPGAEKELCFAVENRGTLDMKYEIGLIVRDGGLSDMLEYSLLSVASESDAIQWFSLATDANAERNSRVSYWTIVEERTLYTEDEESETIRIQSDEQNVGSKIDHYKLILRMKPFENQEQANRYKNTSCEIDIQVIANQNVTDKSEDFNAYEDEAYLDLIDFTDQIYHLSLVELLAENTSDTEEPVMEYRTGKMIAAVSEDETLRFELAENVLVNNPDECSTLPLLISVTPVELPEQILLEEMQHAQSICVQIPAISEDNDVPYTLTYQIENEDPLTAIICSDETGDEIYVISDESTEENPEDIAFTYSYDIETKEISVSYTKAATFTFVFEHEDLDE